MAPLLEPCLNRMAGMHQGRSPATGLDLTERCSTTPPQRQVIRSMFRLNHPTNGSSRRSAKTYEALWQRPSRPRAGGRRSDDSPAGVGFAGNASSKRRKRAQDPQKVRSTSSTKECDAPAVLTAIGVANPMY